MTAGRRRALMALLVGALLVLGVVPVPAHAALVGSVSGVVTAGGRPVGNAWVALIPVRPTGDWAGRGITTTTDSSGRYTFGDVYTDHVKVQVRAPASGGFVTTYWPNAYTFADAGVVRVTAAGATADVDLARGGSIRGRVVDAGSGEVLTGARVTAHVVGQGGWEPVGTPALGAATVPGAFSLLDLPPVPVALHVAPPLGSDFLGQWFDGAGFPGEARPFDGAADSAGVVVALREGAAVAGTVRDDLGAPVEGAEVTLIGCPGLCPLIATTDATGEYRIGSVPPGPALMLFASADAQGLLQSWYRTPGGAVERFDLAVGQTSGDLDVVLTRGAHLSVSVVDAGTGDPLSGLSAELESRSDPLVGYLSGARDRASTLPAGRSAGQAVEATGDPSSPASGADGPPAIGAAVRGALEIGPVPPGDYRLVVYPGYQNPDYLPVTWESATGVGRDGVISLVAGQRESAVVRLARQGAGPAASAGSPAAAGDGASAPGPGSGCGGVPDLGAAAAGGPPGSDVAWPGLAAGFLGPPAAWLAGR